MAKSKPTRPRKVNKNPPNQRSTARKAAIQQTISRLDQNGQNFARLLADPCNGSLCHPVYSGSDTGYLGRYETDFQLNTIYTAGSTAGAVVFCPGAIGISATDVLSSAGNNAVMKLGLASSALTDTSASEFTCVDPTQQPGYNFFLTGSESVRPVAACLQVYYTGTELDRAGTISLARINAGAIINGPNTITTARLRSMSQYVDRTPQSHYEITWAPSVGDQLFTDPSLVTLQRQTERKNGLLLTYSGLSPDKIRVRLVCVYEWIPEATQGLIVDSSSRNMSSNTLDHVLNHLDKAGKWWLNNGKHVVATAGSLYKFGGVLMGGM